MAPLLSVSVAYLIAIIFHYIANRIYTFRVRSADINVIRSIWRYAVVNIINYLIHVGVVLIVASEGGAVQMGMLVGIAITTVTGYFCYRFWVFDGGSK